VDADRRGPAALTLAGADLPAAGSGAPAAAAALAPPAHLDSAAAVVTAPVLCLAGAGTDCHGPVARRLAAGLQSGHPPAGHRRHGRHAPGDDLTCQPRPLRPLPRTGGGHEPDLHPDHPGGAAAGMADNPHAADRLLAVSAVLGNRLRPFCLALHAD